MRELVSVSIVEVELVVAEIIPKRETHHGDPHLACLLPEMSQPSQYMKSMHLRPRIRSGTRSHLQDKIRQFTYTCGCFVQYVHQRQPNRPYNGRTDPLDDSGENHHPIRGCLHEHNLCSNQDNLSRNKRDFAIVIVFCEDSNGRSDCTGHGDEPRIKPELTSRT